jgi:alkylated DNA repair dioxygenase AlkB
MKTAVVGSGAQQNEPGTGESWPQGFAYREEVISAGEECALAERRACGWRYDNAAQSERPGKELFRLLTPLRERAAEIAGVPVQSLRQVLVTEYPPGAVMGWHRDPLMFDDVVALSLLTPCTLRLRRRLEEGWEGRSLEVMPRSAYLLRGPARRLAA